jgi:hypothetical protein
MSENKRKQNEKKMRYDSVGSTLFIDNKVHPGYLYWTFFWFVF